MVHSKEVQKYAHGNQTKVACGLVTTVPRVLSAAGVVPNVPTQKSETSKHET